MLKNPLAQNWGPLVTLCLTTATAIYSLQLSTFAADDNGDIQSTTAGSESNSAAPKEESIQTFLDRYFAVRGDATKFAQITPFYTADMAERMGKPSKSGVPFGVNPMSLSVASIANPEAAFLRGEPTKIKILSQVSEPGDRIRLTLAPLVIPKEYLEQSKKPGFAMSGSVVLVKEHGSWKVYKDLWTVRSSIPHGTQTSSFGFNPDNETPQVVDSNSPKSRPQAHAPIRVTPAKPYDSTIITAPVTRVLKKEQSKGEAFVYLKLKQNGVIEKIFVKTSPQNPAVEKAAYNVVCKSVPFGNLPIAMAQLPYYRLYMKWSPGTQDVSLNQLSKPESWLK